MILVTLTQPLDSQVKVLKSLSESLSHGRDSVSVTREDMFSHYCLLEEHAPLCHKECRYQIYLPFILRHFSLCCIQIRLQSYSSYRGIIKILIYMIVYTDNYEDLTIFLLFV
jgi:hypothetical protein